LHRAYANWFAKRHRSPGHLLHGRFKSQLVEDESYFWSVNRYVHLNPVRSKSPLVSHPRDWRWSSYPGYASRRARVRSGGLRLRVRRLAGRCARPRPTPSNPLQFNGRTRISIAGPEAFDMTDCDYTIFAQIKTKGGGAIFSKTADDPLAVVDKALFIPDKSPSFEMCDGGRLRYVPGPDQVGDGKWHDVAMTYTCKNRRIVFFIDGKPVSAGIVTQKADSPKSSVRIAYAAPGYPCDQNFFVGWISEVYFFQRALTKTEIATLGTDEPGVEPAVAHWIFDASAG
jgi:hypothetical protein